MGKYPEMSKYHFRRLEKKRERGLSIEHSFLALYPLIYLQKHHVDVFCPILQKAKLFPANYLPCAVSQLVSGRTGIHTQVISLSLGTNLSLSSGRTRSKWPTAAVASLSTQLTKVSDRYNRLGALLLKFPLELHHLTSKWFSYSRIL